MLGCFENGVLYLDTPKWEKDDAKALGAKWDWENKKWWISTDMDWRKFRRWLPVPELPRHAPPKGLPSKVARYYLSLLEQANPDKMGNNKLRLDKLTFDEIESGQLRCESEVLKGFWDDAKALQDASPFPIEAAAMTDAEGEQQAPEPAAGIFLACGFPSARKGDERGVVLVLPALLQRDGRLVVAPDMPPVINDAYFEPQDQPRSPILGSLEDLHETQASLDWPERASWSAVWEATNEFFSALNKSNSSLRDYVTGRGKPLSVWAVPYERDDAMVLHLKALYNQLTLDADANAAALYSSICARKEPEPPLSIDERRRLAMKHTGHMSAAFGLDPSQRESLHHLIATPEGRALAVSGPPGTGKTACLQGIIATTLVNATLDDEHPEPPVIVASSATNQAVTNIIKAFGSIADSSDGPTIGSRWLPLVQSYGWYFAARTAAEKEEFQSYQILGRGRGNTWEFSGVAADLGEHLKQEHALQLLRGTYLRSFRHVWSKHAGVAGVHEACNVLLSELKTLTRYRDPKARSAPYTLPEALHNAEHLESLLRVGGLAERRVARERLVKKARRDKRIAQRRTDLEKQAKSLRQRERLGIQLSLSVRGSGRLVAPKGWVARFVAWIRRRLVKQQRRSLVELLAPNTGVAELPADDIGLLKSADHALSSWRTELTAIESKLQRIERCVSQVTTAERDRLEGAKMLVIDLAKLEAIVAWFEGLAASFLVSKSATQWSEGLRGGLSGQPKGGSFDHEQGAKLGTVIATGGTEASAVAYELLDQLLDRTLRRRAFDVAARYWEGQWLLKTEQAKGTNESRAAGLHRQCMLAPVVVGTVYTLPSLFKETSSELALSSADLLIIDEAGQADPAVSVGLFALAKRAIVVGDVEQLKPIWRVGVPQDMGFLRRTDLRTQADYLSEGGLRASTGSAMAAAQKASAYSDTDGRGITLVRHYRCRPTIIEFCNRLIYDSLRPLIPMIPEDPRRLFHPMSYVESDGRASRENGSVVNRVEADELVTWLLENQSAVEQYYNRKGGRLLRPADAGYRDLGDLVGIVAPFTEQCRYLERRLRSGLQQRGHNEVADVLARIKLGTVHKLQGAERPLVLFSATNTPDDGGSPFMDANPDMLNVAISRAQDTFVLFGHPGLFFSKRAERPSNCSPSAVLGRYMKKFGQRLYPRRVVVVESPGKVLHVQTALGRDCVVVATEGHFRKIEALDPSTGRVRWRVDASKQAILSRLAELLVDMDELVIGTDDDREGDAIGWHVVEELRCHCPLDGLTVSRMVFHEVSDTALKQGFAERVAWERGHRAQAAVTRAVIDKAIGEIMSDAVRDRMRQKGRRWSHGIGRVRAALLQLIDEHERMAEGPTKSWCVCLKARQNESRASLWVTESSAADAPATRFADEAKARRVAEAFETTVPVQPHLQESTFTLGHAAPAGTAEILVAAWEKFGLRPGETSRILQDLYEGNRKAVSGAVGRDTGDG
ncbi:MAG: AAA domain-containing protein [Desulfobacteraceae bacterium]